MTNHAVIIGINEYPGISKLNGPCNDAQEFLRWVTHPRLGGVDPAHVHKLLSTDFPSTTDVKLAKPVSDQIAEKLTEVLGDNPTQHVGNRIYIFVAGHGMSDVNRPGSAAVIAANATRNGVTLPHVVVTDYVHYFRRSYTFKEIILIMDCCLDATVLRPLDVTGLLQSNLHPNASQVRLFLANATVWSKKSFEKKINGETRGIFSFAFMEALKKAPVEDDKVTGKAIKNYIDQHIRIIASDKAIEDPTISGLGYEKIVFYERNEAQSQDAATAFTITVRVNNSTGGEMIDLFDGPSVLLASKTFVMDTVEFPVAAGFYKVAIRGTDRHELIEVIKDHEETL